MQPNADPSFDATCVHAGAGPEMPGLGMHTPPLSPPIFQASVFAIPDLESLDRAFEGEPGYYAYSRASNPTVRAFETAIARLEGAEDALACASGMGAISAAVLGLVSAGDRILSTDTIYGNTRSLFDGLLSQWGFRVEHRPLAEVEAAGPPAGTRLLYTEPLSNPTLVAADLPRLAELAHRVGAKLVVDNTFASPYHCRPLELGADLVVHSATKYLGGHGDLIAGVLAGPAESVAAARAVMRSLGLNLAPQEAWLALRGLRSLHLRMARHAENGQRVAEWLQGRPELERIHYPGLPDHPTHAAAARSMHRGFGGMLAFALPEDGPGGGRGACERFLAGLSMIRHAPSLADVGTTVSLPAFSSHRGLGADQRRAQGIGDGLVRLSCGIESAEDIIQDLTRGLAGL